MSACPYVMPKNSLDRTVKRNDIINKIIKRVQDISDYRNFKDDLEVLLFVCQLVEHLVVNKKDKEKLDKKEIVLDVYEKCFGNSINKDLIGKNVQFLFDNKRIKKMSLIKIICGNISDWFERKVL